VVISSSINGTRTFSSAGLRMHESRPYSDDAGGSLELTHYKIPVNAVCPGRIETEIPVLVLVLDPAQRITDSSLWIDGRPSLIV
jgi:NAD(P)-dependent dehydrogenase (short-subunit alcohol dehydrogenase family)